MVDPSRVLQQALPAETYIESVTVDRKQFAATDNLKLAPHPRDLQIDYTSPTFLIPQTVKFRYRLDGYDRDWHEAGTRRQAFYTDLPPGKYSFRVIACNSDGVWDDNAAKLDFSVTPAYYQTNWFRALCAVVLSGAAVGGLSVACPAIASSVRDDAGRACRRAHTHCAGASRHSAAELPALCCSFQTAFPVVAGASGRLRKEKLEARSSRRLKAITEGRDAVQGLRDSTIESNDLALAISTLGEELLQRNRADPPLPSAWPSKAQSRNLHPILRDEAYQIAAEAMRNAFRHAAAQNVEVEIRYDEEHFRIRVRDDGKGIRPRRFFAEQGPQGHYGLPGMRERAELWEVS